MYILEVFERENRTPRLELVSGGGAAAAESAEVAVRRAIGSGKEVKVYQIEGNRIRVVAASGAAGAAQSVSRKLRLSKAPEQMRPIGSRGDLQPIE